MNTIDAENYLRRLGADLVYRTKDGSSSKYVFEDITFLIHPGLLDACIGSDIFEAQLLQLEKQHFTAGLALGQQLIDWGKAMRIEYPSIAGEMRSFNHKVNDVLLEDLELLLEKLANLPDLRSTLQQQAGPVPVPVGLCQQI